MFVLHVVMLVDVFSAWNWVDSSSSLESPSFKLVFSFLWPPPKPLHAIVLLIYFYTVIASHCLLTLSSKSLLQLTSFLSLVPSYTQNHPHPDYFHLILAPPSTHAVPSAPWILPPSFLHFMCPHTPFVLSFLPFHLTHILVSSQSLFPLHLLPTCLPIPENKLKALTQCVPNQNGNVLVKHCQD